VLVQPGIIYGADPGYVRLTYASIDETAITEGIRRLRSAFARARTGTRDVLPQETD
jgi:DNA-binding transcriptional MocR family regulator